MRPAEAWQAALAAEHATAYVLGSLGARVDPEVAPLLRQRLEEADATHRRRRDQVAALLQAQEVAPVGAQAAYAVPETDGPEAVRAAAVALEYACADTYGVVVASTSGRDRRLAARALTECALAVVALEGPTRPLPGQPS